MPDPTAAASALDLSERERRLVDAIDTEGMVAFLCELVSKRSDGGNETAAQELVAAHLERSGLSIDVWELDFQELSRHPAYSSEVDRKRGLGVVGVYGEETEGRRLILNGHIDVVPAGDMRDWCYPPWQGTVADGRV